MSDSHVLFVTRNYPPMTGGMEKYSLDLYNSLKNDIQIDLLKNSKGKKFLPFFLIYCLLFIYMNRRKYSHIHFGDGVLAPLGYIAKKMTGAKISITIHALDVIYDNYIYQKVVPICLKTIDKIVCVSNYSLEQCQSRGISRNCCIVIPNGIDFSSEQDNSVKIGDLNNNYGLQLQEKIILLSVGRLIKRKGILWFVSKVVPMLSDNYIYIIAGDGPEKLKIHNLISDLKLQKKVYMLGRISEKEKICLFKNSSLFIMPNIRVKGDAEGFGITIIEAAAYGLPCVASNIEGIPDAICHGLTGYLVSEGDSSEFAKTINKSRFDKEKIKIMTKQRFNWSDIKKDYVELFLENNLTRKFHQNYK